MWVTIISIDQVVKKLFQRSQPSGEYKTTYFTQMYVNFWRCIVTVPNICYFLNYAAII